MKSIVTIDHLIGPWVAERASARWVAGKGHSIGLMEGSEILAGVYYEDYNGANVICTMAAVPGKRWMTREYLWYCFHYPFNELQVKRMTLLVVETNVEARKLDEHLGFKLEAALKSAHPDGDLLVYAMFREDCRWLDLRAPHNAQKTVTAGETA